MISPSSPSPSFYGDSTGSSRTAGFTRLTFSGLEKTLAKFEKIADSVSYEEKAKVLVYASKSILSGYKEKARAKEATGNLA